MFLINECKYFGCGLEFQSLGDLIYHIEDTHIGLCVFDKVLSRVIICFGLETRQSNVYNEKVREIVDVTKKLGNPLLK